MISEPAVSVPIIVESLFNVIYSDPEDIFTYRFSASADPRLLIVRFTDIVSPKSAMPLLFSVLSSMSVEVRFMYSPLTLDILTVLINGILFCPVITTRQESSDNPGISSVALPDGLKKDASHSVSACDIAIYENGSPVIDHDLILFGRVSGTTISNVSGVPIMGITLGSPTRLYTSQ